MHIADGILSPAVLVGGALGAAAVTAFAASRVRPQDMPRMALCTSFFFVASLMPLPLGPTSVHLMLGGLVGIIAGASAFLPVVVGLALQALLFGHGGITALGVNALVMGLPAYGARWLFRLHRSLPDGAALAALILFIGMIVIALLRR